MENLAPVIMKEIQQYVGTSQKGIILDQINGLDKDFSKMTLQENQDDFGAAEPAGDCLETYETFVSGLGDWRFQIEEYLKKSDEFQNLYEKLVEEYSTQKIIPNKQDIFSALQLTQFSQVKAVIIGLEPMATDGTGLAFSSPKDLKIAPSLKNVFTAIKNNLKDEFTYPSNGDLTQWAKNGVLLLNICLTVRKGCPHSHKNLGWEHFTDAVINAINQNKENVVFMLWGAMAQKKCESINPDKHLKLMYKHPSPLSGTDFAQECLHFSECNKYLISKGIDPIDWNL